MNKNKLNSNYVSHYGCKPPHTTTTEHLHVRESLALIIFLKCSCSDSLTDVLRVVSLRYNLGSGCLCNY